MQRPLRSLTALATLALTAACSKPAPPRAAAAGVAWAVVVLYNQPKDTAAFEKYYAEKHVPLFAAHAQEIGVTRAELVKFAVTIDGKAPTLYREDRKSTRLNSSHANISYAVFCLKKKKK